MFFSCNKQRELKECEVQVLVERKGIDDDGEIGPEKILGVVG